MTTTAAGFLIGAALIAAVDWVAVYRRDRKTEYVAKPAVMLALLGAALTIEAPAPSVRFWFVVALVFSLAGDVFLMLREERFIAGLASFLVAHLAYALGLAMAATGAAGLVTGAVISVVAIGTVGRRIGSSAAEHEPRLGGPVWAYIVVISAMLATAIATGTTAAILGAGLFYLSDALLGWNRFVMPFPHGRVAVIVTYHVGQALLVVALSAL